MTLPLTDEQVLAIKRGMSRAIVAHGVEESLFWQAFPVMHAAVLALPNLELWRNLFDEARWMLVPQMQMNGITLPEEFLRKNPWLLDLRTDDKGVLKYHYGFVVERRTLPR